MSQNEQDWPSQASRRFPTSPLAFGWKVLLIAVISACLLLVLLAGWKLYTLPRSPSGRNALAQTTMSDGTSLVLEQVTFGTAHKFASGRFGGSVVNDLFRRGGARGYGYQLDTLHDVLMIWLTRWDRTTGQPLDFDWWQATVLVDESGEEIEDENPRRCCSGGGSGSNTLIGSRPWAPVTSGGHDLILAASQFPILRARAGMRKLRIYDRSGAVVAEFDANVPNTSSAPEWPADSLPAVRQDEDVTVTLTSVDRREQPASWDSNLQLSHPRRRWAVMPVYSVVWNGQPSSAWKPETVELTDALGNGYWASDCRLSDRESAWKLAMTLARDDLASFEASEQWSFAPIALPGRDSSRSLNEIASSNGLNISLVAVGHGSASYSGPVFGNGNMYTHDGNRAAEKPFGVSASTRTGRDGSCSGQIDLTGDLVHLVVSIPTQSTKHRRRFLVRDDFGREVPHRLVTAPQMERYFLLVDPAAGVSSLQVTVFIHTARTVEFLIAPPGSDASRGPAH
ncbi:MAG: hypothetical protein ACT4QC_09220 [Planctomycetaceae bacterium]